MRPSRACTPDPYASWRLRGPGGASRGTAYGQRSARPVASPAGDGPSRRYRYGSEQHRQRRRGSSATRRRLLRTLARSRGLGDTTPCIPEATAEIWLYSVVDVTATPTRRGFGSPEFSPRLPRTRTTATQKFAICRDEEGERRDSNPRPPGPQPGSDSTCDHPVPDRVQRDVEAPYPRVGAVGSRRQSQILRLTRTEARRNWTPDWTPGPDAPRRQIMAFSRAFL